MRLVAVPIAQKLQIHRIDVGCDDFAPIDKEAGKSARARPKLQHAIPRLRRKVRRSLRACEGFDLRRDVAYDHALELCAHPPEPDDSVWITERLKVLYRRLHTAGVSHSFELWTPGGEFAAGIIGILFGRAALLETMRGVLPHAGNALLSRTVDWLAENGATLCDVQMITPHTSRLGAVLVSRAEFDARLRAAVGERL